MPQSLLSVGIDIGTSTTQLVFSELKIGNTGASGTVPKIEILSKEIVYRSAIHWTPLLDETRIDSDWLRVIIQTEYLKANIRPEELTTGAIIITGETARKENARGVTDALADFAGDFVVATAGPDLEAILAGKGSGAAAYSKETGAVVANLDIGGGTTNICYFKDGQVIATACLDIGGRLIKLENRIVLSISTKLKALLQREGIVLSVGDYLEESVAKKIAARMAELLAQAVGLEEKSDALESMKTNRLITCGIAPDNITFSGGVADCFDYSGKDKFAYNDLGIYLGEAISERFVDTPKAKSAETMRATVIGAGVHSMSVSGSTIEYANFPFPMKNVPVLKIQMRQDDELRLLFTSLEKVLESYLTPENDIEPFALSMKGLENPTFVQVEQMAQTIYTHTKQLISAGIACIVLLETDMAKALGQAIRRRVGDSVSLLCLDGISSDYGDSIDIGRPIGQGKAVPVVVKTLLFNF